MEHTQRMKLDRIFLRRFKKCLGIMFPNCLATTTLLFVLLLGLSFTQQMFIYNTGLIPSQYIEAMVDRDKSAFKQILVTSIIFITATALGKSLLSFVSGVLYVKWRGNLTKYIHVFYFGHDSYYELNVLQRDIDNLDQRITQDVDKLSSQFSNIFSTLIITPFIVGYYTYQCYKSTGYIGPVSIYGYFVVATIINKLIMAPIVKLVFKQEKLEGNFRFKHMQLRVNSESTAFYHSGLLEEKKTNAKLDNLLGVQLQLVNYQFVLQCSMNFFDYFGAIFSYIIVSIPLFSGKFDGLMAGELAAIVSKYSFVSMYLIHSFTQLIDLSNKVSDIAGYTHRVGELLEFFKNKIEPSQRTIRVGELVEFVGDRNEPSQSTMRYQDDLDDDIVVKIENLTYSAPLSLDKPLVKDLYLDVSSGRNLLITGKTGSGKSSLLRIMCGLWQADSGNVMLRRSDGKYSVFFLPQKPLLTDGSMKQQIVYPEDENSLLDDLMNDSDRNKRIQECLDLVKLVEVCERAGGLGEPVEWNWEDVLSPGEMQRISFARLFYHQPECAVLDEASSALDVDTENEFYRLCKSFGITLVTVGHRESLQQYHDDLLQLDGKGGWKYQSLS